MTTQASVFSKTRAFSRSLNEKKFSIGQSGNMPSSAPTATRPSAAGSRCRAAMGVRGWDLPAVLWRCPTPGGAARWRLPRLPAAPGRVARGGAVSAPRAWGRAPVPWNPKGFTNSWQACTMSERVPTEVDPNLSNRLWRVAELSRARPGWYSHEVPPMVWNLMWVAGLPREGREWIRGSPRCGEPIVAIVLDVIMSISSAAT
jgi:hypothetical protein